MGVSDAVARNLTTVYLAVIAAVKAHALVTGQCFGGVFVLVVSTTVVGVILIASLIWDVYRKTAAAKAAPPTGDRQSEICRGGICWHGVAVRSPASEVRFSLPQDNTQNLA